MYSKRCNGCDRATNLLNAKCGHKTCFFCIKDNRSANKCKKCVNDALPTTSRSRSQSVSPIRNNKSV